MKKEIIQIKNKIQDFHGRKVLATFKVVSNSLSGEFILFERDDNLGFCLTKCFKNNKLKSSKSSAYTKLSDEIGYELFNNQEEIMDNLATQS